MSLITRVRDWERRTRPTDPAIAAAMDRRWEGLPEHVKTPAQLLGRRTTGCEGTHGVFPACDFACKPCYHSADANKVRVDGEHTKTEVAKQMDFLHEQRGPQSHVQLIGGEVSLLEAEDHAATIDLMRARGRVPMSFSHGDVSDQYLRDVALDSDGKKRWADWSWAVHFDRTMFGREGAKKPQSERELQPFRKKFMDMVEKLREETGLRHYVAHNMTVTPDNVAEVAEVVRDSKDLGFRMMSFQPAAYVGNEQRWTSDFREVTDDSVWAEIEDGVGTRLPYKALQFGDFRCNRVSWGAWVDDSYVPVLDEDDADDLHARDEFFRVFKGNYISQDRSVIRWRVARLVLRNPGILPVAFGWFRRFAKRAGGLRALRSGPVHPMTYVMHNFMDARVVAPAWELNKVGEVSDDVEIRAAQERLAACAYTMGHPESNELIPACVQHSILDPNENRELVSLLPMPTRRKPQPV
ncbi:MAG: radical SAM domain-containing protein [Ilumatobacter sp.]|uniref:radical SAM domain-containing protein n=1 Tax=Ilumatobacter sp. TaxID=1967498 RepID=UPI0032979980